MKYGYVRISTKRQSLQRQIDNISKIYPDAEIVKEVFTGTTSNRPAWNRLLARVQKGDTIIFDSVSRMSRNADEGIQQYMELYHHEINLVFLKEPMIDTDVYRQSAEESIRMTGTDVDLILNGVNKYLARLAQNQIRIAFEQAEKEVRDLQQRTKEGMKANGAAEKISKSKTGTKYITETHLINSIAVLQNAECFGGKMKDVEISKLIKVHRVTVSRLRKELSDRMNSENLTQPELVEKLKTELKKKHKKHS